MNSDRRNWSTAAMGRQTPVADQVVLGHLLPRYQAAQDWQQTVQAALALQGSVSGGKRSIQIGILTLLCETVRRERNRSMALPKRTEMAAS
jgi:lipopolysaccharide biosynthesis regulator YciM